MTGSYFNSRRTFSSRMKYQIYRSLRRSETGMSDIEKLASRYERYEPRNGSKVYGRINNLY